MTTDKYEWSLEAYENHGNLWLKWSTNSPFRDQQGQIYVYKGDSFPENPANTDLAKWNWDTNGNNWDTGLSWGTGWHCARGAQAPVNGPYVSFCRVVTNSSMGPNVAKSA